MFESDFLLSTDAHLLAAKHNKTLVTVWKNGYSTEKTGGIEEVDEEFITIQGTRYSMLEYEFRVYYNKYSFELVEFPMSINASNNND